MQTLKAITALQCLITGRLLRYQDDSCNTTQRHGVLRLESDALLKYYEGSIVTRI